MESSSCFQSITTLVIRLLVFIYTEKLADVSVPKEVVINLLLDIENLLPAILHSITTDFNGKEFTFYPVLNLCIIIMYCVVHHSKWRDATALRTSWFIKRKEACSFIL